MRILAKTTSTIAIVTASVVSLGFNAERLNAKHLNAEHLSAACLTVSVHTDQLSSNSKLAIALAGYEPPDNIGGPGSSQGSGTR
ncbi:MAG: hypothetical protein HC881_20155 [Leptolyngbyaceae cyanobacterium SL_7_1]|nr:hypothetical protein [Leptolyngbyaceae cyanobacterium SL_7_1]